MTTNEYISMPAEITAGDSLSIRLIYSDYPASDGWSIIYALTTAANQIIWTSAADGDAHQIDLSPSDTAGYTPGQYKYHCLAKKGATDRHTLSEGFVTIRPNLEAATTGYDARPFPYVLRDALEAAIAGRASETQTAISIKDRTISEMSHNELLEALREANRKVMLYERRQRIKSGQASGGSVKVKFV